jgi:hypothetical protein
MRRRGKRYNYLLDKIEETRGYWNLKEEALHSTPEHASEQTMYLS